MVRFLVNGAPLNTSDLSVNWATGGNGWQGVCQNGSTALTTSDLNATITTCGYLKEPTNGILPAGARVILATSTNLDANFNSFDGLSDTLYIIYQCNGNTVGHFGNHGSSSIRSFSMSFSNPTGCSDAVSYNRNFLTNQLGGTGGSSAEKDGGTVNYTPNGTATYVNNGCQAPITPNTISISAFPIAICPLDTINLNALSTNPNVVWKGGNGTFTNQNNVNTVYRSTATDVFPIKIYAGFLIPCGDTLFDSTEIVLNTTANIFVTPTALSLCDGETITLTASGASSFIWSDGSTGTTLTIDTAGTFYAATNQCGIDTASVDITWNGSAPSVALAGNTSICQGESTQITASGDGPFTWHNNTIGTVYNSTSDESIYASVTNSCGSDTARMTIVITGTPPTANVTGNLTVCGSDSTTLTANGGDNYLWSNGSTDNSIVTDSSGFLIATNNCGFDTTFYTLAATGALPTATITGDPNICDNETSLFTASGGDNYLWHNGNNTGYFTTNLAENIYVIAYNICGEDTAFLNLIDHSVTADFDITDSIGYQPLSIDFTNLSINANKYNWDFDNGTTSTEEHEQQTYTTAGKFDVSLTASNNYCLDIAYQKITILDNTNIFIPNTFSPNGDYINDVFKPILSNITSEDYQFNVFDRNGGIIFSTESLDESWNGTERGTLAPNGVYIWKIDYKVEGEIQKRQKMGHVTLLK